MFKYFILFVFLIVSVASGIGFHDSEEDYVSQESKEITEINTVIDSESKEDFNKLESQEIDKHTAIFNNKVIDSESKEDLIKIHRNHAKNKIVIDITSKEKVDKPNRLTANKQKADNSTYATDGSSEYYNSSINSKPLVNATSFNCDDKRTSSSEESHCSSTLVSYPFSVSLQKKGAHYASGALIDKQHVLTAAGVFFNVRETIKLFRARLGSVDCKKGGVLFPIKLVEIHPSYVMGQPAFDVAILTLSQPVETTEYIRPVPLSTVEQGVLSAKFLTTYWPRLIIKGQVLPTTANERVKHQNMRVSTQKMIPWKTCAGLMKARKAELHKTSLCLKPIAMHHSVCMPDVGAPVVAEDGLWGITSGWTSELCSKNPSPTIFTRTALEPVRSWLKTIL